MRNFVQPGNTVTLAAPTGGVKSGAPVLIGALFGVAAYDAAEAAEVEVALAGVFDLPKDGTALEQGAPAYFDVSAGKITATGGVGNWLVGVAVLTAGVGATVARVRLGAVAVEGA